MMSPSERRLGRIVPPPMSALQSRTSQLAVVVARDSARYRAFVRPSRLPQFARIFVFHDFRSGASLRDSE